MPVDPEFIIRNCFSVFMQTVPGFRFSPRQKIFDGFLYSRQYLKM